MASSVSNCLLRTGKRLIHRQFFKTYASKSDVTKFPPINSDETESTSQNTRNLSREAAEKVSITFVRHDGVELTRTGTVGETLRDMVDIEDPDIIGYGTCEGTISCSTCHIILSPEDFARLGSPSEEELDLIGYAPETEETSRLGCTIFLDKSMDGMKVRLPTKVMDMRGSEEEISDEKN